MSVSGDRVAELEGRIVELVQRTAPPGWRRIDLRCAATVAVSEVTATVLAADGTAVPSEGVPSQLTDLLMELRRAHYEPGRGTWFSALFLIEPGVVERLYNWDFDPLWDPPIPAECYQRDQVVMPRAPEHTPAWLAARLEGREPEYRPDPDPEPLNPVQQMQLMTHDLAMLLADHAPALWRRLHGYYQAVGDHVEFPPVTVFSDDGTTRPWTPPAAAGALLDRLRAGMYAFEGGVWSRFEFQVCLDNGRVIVDGTYQRDAEPAWNTEPSADDVRRELQRFPMEQAPDWMSRRLGGAATRTFRKARVFDHAGSDGARPSVSRPPVAPDEAERLAEYLHNAPLVRAARSYAPDQLAPERGDRVPLTFHTDGTWIWAGAVGYYLREHGLPPEPDLVAHIRARGFRVPEVDEPTLQAATAALSGKPAPAPSAPEPAAPPPAAADPASPGAAPAPEATSAPDPAPEAVPAQAAEEAAGEETDGGYRWRTFELRPPGEVWVARVRRRLEELGVDPGSYRLEATAEGAWCLVRDGLRWAVFRYEDGERRDEAVFDSGRQAAAHLLGALLLVPQQQDTPDSRTVPMPRPSNASAPPADTSAPQAEDSLPQAGVPAPPADVSGPQADALAPPAGVPASPVDVSGPQAGVADPPPHADVPAPQAGVPARPVDVPDPQAGVAAPPTGSPAPPADAPASPIDVSAPQTDIPRPPTGAPAPQAGVPVPPADVAGPRAGVPAPSADAPAPEADVSAPPAGASAPQAGVPAPPADALTPPTDVPAAQADVSAPPANVPASQAGVPNPPADVSAPQGGVPAPSVDVPATQVDVPAPQAVPPTAAEAPPTMVEQPYEPLEGEPPLSLFRDMLEIELQVGDTVDRFGEADGNVAYTARIPFGQRSLPPDWANRPYRLYRVERPVRVLSGVAIPWFDQPGGGKAYVFRRPLGELVAEGVLAEVRDAPPPPG